MGSSAKRQGSSRGPKGRVALMFKDWRKLGVIIVPWEVTSLVPMGTR